MIYLSGVTNDRIEAALMAAGIGLFVNPKNGYHLRVGRYPWWAFDNGCFKESPENPFNEDQWINKLSYLSVALSDAELARCLFVVAPDVYPDSKASLERGMEYAPLLHEMGFPVAIVAQGTHPGLAYPFSEFDCLFIGGQENRLRPKAEWKVSADAESLVREARRHGLWVHMGRVNSWWRIERAREMGCCSADGTFVKYRKQRRASDLADERHARGESEVSAWTQRLEAEPVLWRHESPAHSNHRRTA